MSVIINKGDVPDKKIDPYICPRCDSQVKKRIRWSDRTEHWICKNPDCDYHIQTKIKED